MRYEVTLPALGEEGDEVQEGTVSVWLVEVGETVEEGDDLVEIVTDKAAFVVPSPKSGIVEEKLVSEGERVEVGETLCVLEI